MNSDVRRLTWPASRLGEAIEAIARKSDLSPRQVEAPNPASSFVSNRQALSRWVETTAGLLGLEAEPVETTYPEVGSFVRGAGPALVPVSDKVELRYLALLGSKGRDVLVLAPDASTRRLSRKLVCDALTADHQAPLEQGRRRLADQGRGARAAFCASARCRSARTIESGSCRRELAVALAAGSQLLATTSLRATAATPAQARGFVRASIFLALLAWWILGKAALGDQLERGWLLAWALLLLTAVPFRLFATWSQGLFAIGAGSLLKQRLLYGALRLEPEEVRREGAGQMIGRVIESSAVESLALSGGFLGLVAAIELVMAAGSSD